MQIELLNPLDKESISHLADWYFEEWAVLKETTVARLSRQDTSDICFHLIAKKEDQLIATGGIHFNVGLARAHEEFKQYSPWVSMVYCNKAFRNQGIGELVLIAIEQKGFELGYSKLYLYTNSAERLYLRNQWNTFARLLYKGKETAVMSKEIKS